MHLLQSDVDRCALVDFGADGAELDARLVNPERAPVCVEKGDRRGYWGCAASKLIRSVFFSSKRNTPPTVTFPAIREPQSFSKR